MKNRALEFYRFVFAIVICMHHIRGYVTAGSRFSNFFGAGYLAVDLFFIISGYFLAAHHARSEARDDVPASPGEAAMDYALGRWKRLFAIHTWAWFVAGAVQVYIWQSLKWRDAFTDGFFEFFMLEITGIGTDGRVNGPGWYCSALVICSLLIYFLLSKNKKTFLYVTVPLSSAVIFSYFCNQYGHLNRWTQHPLVVCDGLFRGFAEMGIGCICYEIVTRLQAGGGKGRLSEGWEKALYSVGEVVCFGVVLYTMWMPQGYQIGKTVALEFICIPFMALFVVIVLSGKSVFHRILDNRLSGLLGRLSLYIYLNHIIIQRSVSKYLVDWRVRDALMLYMAVVIGYSLVTMLIFEWAGAKVRRKKASGT